MVLFLFAWSYLSKCSGNWKVYPASLNLEPAFFCTSKTIEQLYVAYNSNTSHFLDTFSGLNFTNKQTSKHFKALNLCFLISFPVSFHLSLFLQLHTEYNLYISASKLFGWSIRLKRSCFSRSERGRNRDAHAYNRVSGRPRVKKKSPAQLRTYIELFFFSFSHIPICLHSKNPYIKISNR